MFSPFNLNRLLVLGKEETSLLLFSSPFFMLHPGSRAAQGGTVLPTLSCYHDIVAKIAGTLQESEEPLTDII